MVRNRRVRQRRWRSPTWPGDARPDHASPPDLTMDGRGGLKGPPGGIVIRRYWGDLKSFPHRVDTSRPIWSRRRAGRPVAIPVVLTAQAGRRAGCIAAGADQDGGPLPRRPTWAPRVPRAPRTQSAWSLCIARVGPTSSAEPLTPGSPEEVVQGDAGRPGVATCIASRPRIHVVPGPDRRA